jgi:hypothetical protein
MLVAASRWLKRLAWLAFIWLASVTVLAMAAYLMRLLMHALGLSTA